MREKHAKLIRIGIMSKCIPYKADNSPETHGAQWEVFDYAAYREYQYSWLLHMHHPLVAEAHDRTKPWKVIRYYD